MADFEKKESYRPPEVVLGPGEEPDTDSLNQRKWMQGAEDLPEPDSTGFGQAGRMSVTSTTFNSPFQRSIELKQGDVIGGVYRIEKLIGRGGMGQVYLAEHMSLSKPCALKILPSNQVTEQGWQRFQSEAKLIARLDHPNLVRVTDLGIHESSLPYFAMDYVEGQSLQDYVSQHGPLDQETTLEILGEICAGIECAHRNGIVHRDLSPANIMLVESNSKGQRFKVKILDFGLAKLAQKDASAPNVTATGEIFGSPLYMSPEQCSGEPVDTRSDIYSLGCTVYECLTGRPPFAGTNPIAIMSMKMTQKAPALSEATDSVEISKDLEKIVAGMIRRQPQDRYQSIADLEDDLELLKLGRPPRKGSAAGRHQEAKVKDDKKKAALHANGALDSKRLNLVLLSAVLVAGIALTVAIPMAVKQNLPGSAPTASALPEVLTFPGTPEFWLQRYRQASKEQDEKRGSREYREHFLENVKAFNQLTDDCVSHLVALGPSAIPACIKDFGDQTGAQVVSNRVLTAGGPASVEPLTKLLVERPALVKSIAGLLDQIGSGAGSKLCAMAAAENPNKEERNVAVMALSEMVKQDQSRIAFPHDTKRQILNDSDRHLLIQALKSETNSLMKRDLLFVLSYFKSPTAESESTILRILKQDKSPEVTEAAATTLGSMLTNASKIAQGTMIKGLLDALAAPDQSESTKIACLSSLAKAQGTLTHAQVEQLRAAKNDPSESVRQGALQALSALAPNNNECIKDLGEALKESDIATLSSALTAAQNINPSEGKSLLPSLVAIASRNDRRTGYLATRAISHIGAQGNKQVEDLILRNLEGSTSIENWHTMRDSIEAVGQLGPRAIEAKPALKRLSEQHSFPFSHVAKSMLEKIESGEVGRAQSQ